jgi:hypothetical protein
VKPIPEGEFVEYPEVTLYREDLEELESLFRSECERITIRTPGAEWESIEALAGSGQRIVGEFEINAYDPHVHFEMRPYLCRLYLSNKRDTAQRGIESLVRAVVTRRSRIWTKSRIGLIGWALFAAGLAGAFAVRGPWGGLLFIGGVVAWAASGYAVYKLHMTRSAVVHLASVNDRPSFWRNNRDSIIVAVLGAAFGTIIGSALTLVAQAVLK